MKLSAKPEHRTNRAAAVLVEFAIVLPIIMFMFAAMIEISRVLLLQHTADTAAYEGARSGMVPGSTAQEARDMAIELLNVARLKSTTVTVAPSTIVESTPLITVRVEIPVAANSWIVPKLFTQFSVSSQVTIFTERPPAIQLTGVPELVQRRNNGRGGGPGGNSGPGGGS